MIRGKTISGIDFFEKEVDGKKEWFANVYYNNSKPPIQITKAESLEYLEKMMKANDIDPKDNTAVSQLIKKGLFTKTTEEEANKRFAEEMEKKKSKIDSRLAKKAIIGTLAIGTGIALLVASCSLIKSNKDKDLSNSQKQGDEFASLLAKLSDGPKKDAVRATQLSLKNFNDTLSGSIMREGEDKRLAHSWDENIATYLAFNNFTDEELFQIFDTYKFDGNYFYDQLKLSNMKEMLYYARATQPSGRVDLIKSEEGKAFFTKYETLVLNFNKAETKEEKVAVAKEFYAMVRSDFPINIEDKEGFIHTEKGYEDYSYTVTPMISAMEVMTRNVGVSLNNQEVKFFNELGMCNFAEEKLQEYQAALENRQTIEVAKKELRSELSVTVNHNGTLSVTEDDITYEQLREVGIASIQNYDLSEEKNDVGTIPGYWEDATLDTAKKQQIENSIKKGSTTTTSTKTYNKTVTEEGLKKQSPKVQEEATKQKEEINKQFEQQNALNKEESDKKKEQVEKEIQKEKEQLEEEIKQDNAWMDKNENTSSTTQNSTSSTSSTTSSPINNSTSSTTSTTVVPTRPSRGDVDDHINIDDEYVDENGNLKFDGPIYDKDGNIIDNPSAKANAKASTYVQTSNGLYVPSTVEEVNSYVDSLADQNSAVNQTTNSSMTK